MPVIGFARISGGAPGSVRAMVDHLVNRTLAAPDLKLGTYYPNPSVAAEQPVMAPPPACTCT